MRLSPVVLFASATLVASSCLVDVTGAKCNGDSDCPADQRCVLGAGATPGNAGTCALGTREDGGAVGGGMGGGGGAVGGGGGAVGGGGGAVGGGGGGGGGGGEVGGGGGAVGGGGGAVGGGAGGGSSPMDGGPADRCGGACTASGPCGCAVYELHTDLANTQDVLMLEGRFGDAGVRVRFPGPDGGVLVAASLGPGFTRAAVTVPAAATAGPLVVELGAATSTSTSFRRASYTLGLGRFDRQFEQSTYAIPMPKLLNPRARHSAVVVGDWLYVIGGGSFVERARVNADGTLGRFSIAQTSSYGQGHTLHVVGDTVLLVGGSEALNSVATNTVRAARRDPVAGLLPRVGSMELFSTVGSLATPRKEHASVIIGEHLYVIGGRDDTGAPLDTVERATLFADGSLSSFQVVPGLTLGTARSGHSAVVFRDQLFVLGGRGASTALQTIERATIEAGGLGAFSAAGGLDTAREGAVALGFGDRLFVLGGNTITGDPTDTVEQATFDPGQRRFGAFSASPGSTLAGPTAFFATAVVGNSLLAIGGARPGALTEVSRASLNESGLLGPPQPPRTVFAAARTGALLVVFGRHLFVLGGEPGNTIAHAPINPDFSLGAFTPVSVTTLGDRRGGRAAVVADTLYVVGSTSLQNDSSGAIVAKWRYEADGGLGALAADGALGPRHATALVALEDNLWALGGRGVPGDVLLDSRQVADVAAAGTVDFITDPVVDLRTPRAGHGLVVSRDGVYLLGGDTADAGSASVDRIGFGSGSGGLGSSDPLLAAGLVNGRSDFVTVTVGNTVYVFAGRSGTQPRLDVERATLDGTGRLGTFSAASPLEAPGAGGGHAAIVLGNSLYYFVGVSLTEYPLR